MMRTLRYVGVVLAAAAVVVAGGSGAWAQEDGEARLGGASDVADDTVVRIPQGGEIGALHYIFVDNPEDEPIEVEFLADVPVGISVEPEWERQIVPARSRAENSFGIRVGPEVAAGEYEVIVQLVRSDIEAQPGRITNIPAVQTSFVVEVTGEAGSLTAHSVSALSGEPVSGTLTAAAETEDGDYFELARTEGSSLAMEVAPGEYRVSFLLGDRTLDTADVVVVADQTTEVTLDVETVSFVVAAARPSLDDGRPVVVELTTAVNNEAEPITTGADLQVTVLRNGTDIDTVTLDQLADLPIGLTEASATYRPSDGWTAGSYRFQFELVTSHFTLVAPQVPAVDVPPTAPGWDVRFLIFAVAGAILVLLLVDRITRDVLGRIRRRRRLRGGRHQPDGRPPDDDPEAAPRSHSSLASQPTVKWGPVASPSQASVPDDEERPPGAESHTEANAVHHAREPATLIPPPTSSPIDNHHRTATGTAMEEAARVTQSMRIAQRLADQGALAPDWSVADAAMVYWAMTSEQVHEALASLGMDDQEYITAISKLLHLGLLDPASR